MMILTGTGDYAYKRTDGVWVVPIGCLRPKVCDIYETIAR